MGPCPSTMSGEEPAAQCGDNPPRKRSAGFAVSIGSAALMPQ
ncbi:hypothetical protein FM119_03615 [Mycetocola reblochoni REB411]|uniref:Uncharacterized protein n=1 Tax=Mycetocola reblochoni REB411 TaxID=1255698 RepID=A0A1R4IUQ9_9MICO|nr:hypothetical protein FM119_03615 [Mycetocola reblochoni REB411]